MPSISPSPSSSGPTTAAASTSSSSPPRPLWDAAIHKAALGNDLEKCQWLLALDPCLLEARGFNGVLPVHCAARKGALPVLRLLAQRGVDLKGRDNGQWTILHHAAAGGHTSVLKTMLLGGLMLPPPPPSAGPEEAGSAGRSSSPSAVLDVNVRAADGTTPLLVAVMEGHPAAVRLLLHCGADPQAANAKGESALSHTAKFLATQAKRAHVYEPLGRVKKGRGTWDREAVAALVHSSLYHVAVLQRLRADGTGWGLPLQEKEEEEEESEVDEKGQSVVMGVLTALVLSANDDVFGEALRYLKGDPAEKMD